MTPAAAAARLAGDAIDAHGGLERWRGLRAVTLELSSGGLAFRSRLQPRALRAVTATVASKAQHVTLQDFPRRGWASEYEGGTMCVRGPGGRRHRDEIDRSAFRRLRRQVRWSSAELGYFAACALWTYVSLPFVLVADDVQLRSLGPWDEGGEHLDRLEVRLPARIHTHSPVQVLHLDAERRIRRHDYTAQLFGQWATAAHWCSGHRWFDGLLVPTRRRVVPRRRDGRARSGPLLVWIDVHGARVVT